eukprot:3939476-Rhodomonas_salina.2
MQLLLEAHEFCARRIRMWTVWNLLPLRAIQGKSISECIFCSDILSLTQVGRQRVELTLKLGAVEATMTGSPLNQVTLPEEVQVRGGIPREAKFFCFCYPPRKQAKGLPEAIRSFLRLGRFLYFNDSFEVVSLSALSDCASNKQETRSVLHLGPPLPMPQSAMDSIGATRRWWRVARKKTLTVSAPVLHRPARLCAPALESPSTCTLLMGRTRACRAGCFPCAIVACASTPGLTFDAAGGKSVRLLPLHLGV